MKKAYLFILFCLFLISNYSCKEPAPSMLMQQTDSLLLEVDSLNNKIISANLDSIRNLYIQILREHTLLSENLSISTEPSFNKEIYVELDSIMQIIGFCLKACNEFHSEVSIIESHLVMIKEDVLEGEFTDSSLITKVEQESSLLDDLTDRILLRMNLLQTQMDKYNIILPEIRLYVKQASEKNPTE